MEGQLNNLHYRLDSLQGQAVCAHPELSQQRLQLRRHHIASSTNLS